MNLVEARIEARNGSLVASFGDQELPIPDAPGQSRPGLGRYEGQTIALGIRPHNFEDAALASDAPARLRGTVQITEALGSELVAYVSMRGKAVHHEAVIEGAVYEAEEQVSVEEISVGTREGETTLLRVAGPDVARLRGRDDRARGRHAQAPLLRPRERSDDCMTSRRLLVAGSVLGALTVVLASPVRSAPGQSPPTAA